MKKSGGQLSSTPIRKKISSSTAPRSPGLFGTPCHPSPLDRIRTRHVSRGVASRSAAGVAAPNNMEEEQHQVQDSSFEANQSCPGAPWRRRPGDSTKARSKTALGRDRWSALQSMASNVNSFSFSAGQRTSRVNRIGDSPSVGGKFAENCCDPISNAVLNPNRGILCVDESGRIVVVNDIACRMLCYTEKEVVNVMLADLIVKERDLEALTELDGPPPFKRVLVSNKIVEMRCGNGDRIVVSLWMKQLDKAKERQLAVIEQVERTCAKITVSDSGTILKMDPIAELLFQQGSTQGKSVLSLFPHLDLATLQDVKVSKSKMVKKKLTGRTSDNNCFPLALQIEESPEDETTLLLTALVFTNISGLVILETNGHIATINQHLSSLLFGYRATDLNGEDITNILPSFYEEIELLESFVADDDDHFLNYHADHDESLGCRVLETSPTSNRNVGDMYKLASALQESLILGTSVQEKENLPPGSAMPNHYTSPPSGSEGPPARHLHSRETEDRHFPEGSFCGVGKHKDGSQLSILYQIKRVTLDDGSAVHCLWISRDPDDQAEESWRHSSWTLASSLNATTNISLGQAIQTASEKQKAAAPSDSQDIEDDALVYEGAYSDNYVTLHQIGKGAFGFVRAGYRKSDCRMVITKFMEKKKILDEYWVTDGQAKRVPMEICLLSSLSHPNVVGVLEVFENELYYQMVMEKHGAGMDLFEFVDRAPNLDEPITSHLFRQIVSGVDYLHGSKILHRDIKDENVIIDEHFHVKLIDFGSAAFYRPGHVFNTFYGTVEYCSPEVLEGNPYEGPELEMWSLGVLLYILLFLENPFFGVEETIECRLCPPREVSPSCWNLLQMLLAKDPSSRIRLPGLKMDGWVNQSVELAKYRFQDVVQCSEDEVYPVHYFLDPTVESFRDHSGSFVGGHHSVDISGNF